VVWESLPEEGRADFLDWATGLKHDTAPAQLSYLFPAPSNPNKGRQPKAQEAIGEVTAEQLREARQKALQTGNWDTFRSLANASA